MAVAEAYPDLKANQTMMQLSEELTSTENKVSFARQAYNDAVMTYNNARETFRAALPRACSASSRTVARHREARSPRGSEGELHLMECRTSHAQPAKAMPRAGGSQAMSAESAVRRLSQPAKSHASLWRRAARKGRPTIPVVEVVHAA